MGLVRQDQQTAQRPVRELERKYAEAVKRRDAGTLDGILAADLVEISSRAEVRNKQQGIDDFKGSPDFKVEAFDLDDLNVRIFDDTAVVSGRSTLRVIYKGQSNTNQFRHPHVAACK